MRIFFESGISINLCNTILNKKLSESLSFVICLFKDVYEHLNHKKNKPNQTKLAPLVIGKSWQEFLNIKKKKSKTVVWIHVVWLLYDDSP